MSNKNIILTVLRDGTASSVNVRPGKGIIFIILDLNKIDATRIDLGWLQRQNRSQWRNVSG